MKYILIFLLVILCSVGYAQYPVNQTMGAPTTLITSRGGFRADSSLILPQFPDTASANKSPYIKFYPGNMIRVYNDIYMRNTTATGWILISNGGGSNNFVDSLKIVNDSVYARKYGLFIYQYKTPTTDTTSLSNRINQKLNISDTAAMLAPYSTRINNKIDSIYRSGDSIYAIKNGVLIFQYIDPAIDTTSLSNRINEKIDSLYKSGDSVYARKNGAFIFQYIDPAIDTTSLSNRIDLKLNISDTASMLSAYYKSADTVNLRRVKYVGLTMPSAFNVTGSPITDSGTIAVTGAGTSSQYVRGDGVLASFPTATTGGGASVSYYLNGSVNKGTFGGETYYEMSRTAIIGAGTDFTRTNAQGNGVVAQFITDTITNLLIPAGNWNLEMYFSASSGGGTPSFYTELYKYDGTTFTLIASSATNPELIAFGTTISPYFTALAVPETALSGTDRLAIRVYVTTSGRSITLHTEDNHLCQIITTFTTGLTTLNGLTKQVQYFATGTSGTDFNISSSNDTHTFNLPNASATNRGALSSTDWSTFNGKVSPSDTANKWITNVFRKTASDSVFFVRGGSNNFAFRDSTGAAGWGLLGNSGTSDATNFIGTTDNQDVIFRRNNVISGRIDSTSQSSGNGGITAFGFGANPTAPNATAFGFKALARNTSSPNATGNVAVGNLAGTNITSGERNTIIGHNSMPNATVGSYNSTLGYATLGPSTGDLNTAIGAHALGDNQNASQNTALGDFAGGLTTTGGNNTFLGSRAGRYNTTGSNQIFINSRDRSNYSGDQTGSPFYAQQNSTVTNQIVTLNGRVGINTISPSASAGLQVESTTQGFLQPRLTTTQMNAISTPATGLSVFNTTDSVEYTYRGTTGGWQKNVIYNRNNDVALFNGANQRIMIDTTTNIIAGRTLTVEAGSTQSGGTSAFQALSQTTRTWRFMAAASNGDIYAATLGQDIYKRTGGTGNFVSVGAGNRNWYAVAIAPNGDIYASVFPGDIYKQTGGAGAFNALSQTTRNWTGMAAASNGDIFACDYGGFIYKQTGGTGNFTAVHSTARNWTGLAIAPNGDIYACVDQGDIYKSTNGGTTFTGLGQTNQQWFGIAAALNGDIYACVISGAAANVYKQTLGVGNFISMNQTNRVWFGVTVAPSGDIYASVSNGDIYLQGQGTANLNGGTLVLQSGVGKGTGTSTINFNTGTTLSSGATLQTASTKMTILGNGNVGIGTTSPSSILDVSSTTSGFLPPRMTTAQMNAILSPAVGSNVFNTTDSSIYIYRGTGGGWQSLATGGGGNIYTTNGSLTGARTLTLNNFPLSIAGNSSDNTSRFHANGNTTLGNIAVNTNDSSYRLNIMGNASGASNVLSLVMRPNVGGGQRITFSQSNDVFNNINSNAHTVITSTNTLGLFGGGVYLGPTSGNNTYIGYNYNTGAITSTVVGGSSAPDASSILDVRSTTRGFLQPRLTTTQMNAISTPATGLSVFNTTDSVPYTYRGTTGGWQKNVIYNRNNDVALFNGANQRIMIDTTTNIVAGRTLTVEAGSTISGGTSAFQALSQTSRQYVQMTATTGGDIYVAAFNGDIFKRTGGTGNFTALSQTSRQWVGIAAAPNGDVFASVINGTIYKQTGGTGNFVSLGITGRDYRGMCVAPNGDIYVCVNAGDIFKSTDNGVTFTALSQTSRAWYGMAAASNGDIYACVNGGDVYKQTGGTGNFVAMGFTSRNYQFITITAGGDIYATTYPSGNIFRSSGGSDLISLNQTVRDWQGIVAALNGDIYANVFGGDIYIQTGGTANLNGGTLVLQSGVGKGTGTSTINFNTGTTLASGTTLQTASTKMTILGNGNVGIGTTSPSAKLELSDTARGFLQTRMTTTQRNNIASPSVGLQVFTTTDSSQYVYRGTGAGWQQIANEIVNTGTLDFPSTNGQTSSDLTITLTGAVDGDAVVLGVPNAAMNANSNYSAWVSSANTVTIRLNNYGTGTIDPASATFKVTIIK